MGKLNDRFTGYGIIQPGARDSTGKSRVAPKPKPAPKKSSDNLAGIKAKIAARKEENAALRRGKEFDRRYGIKKR